MTNDEFKNKILDLIEVLQKLLDSKVSDDVKKCKKHCDSIIDIVGEYDASLKQK
jgi:hypothetical protein